MPRGCGFSLLGGVLSKNWMMIQVILHDIGQGVKYMAWRLDLASEGLISGLSSASFSGAATSHPSSASQSKPLFSITQEGRERASEIPTHFRKQSLECHSAFQTSLHIKPSLLLPAFPTLAKAFSLPLEGEGGKKPKRSLSRGKNADFESPCHL